MDHGTRDRAVLLLHGTGRRHTDRQMQLGIQYCADRGYHLIGVARGFAAAEQMIRAGEAEVLVAPSRRYFPFRLEIVSIDLAETQTHRGRRARRVR
jgi:hypothetical protein